MCWKHKWGKWKQYEFIYKHKTDGRKAMVEYRQQRECSKCGKKQDRLLALIG